MNFFVVLFNIIKCAKKAQKISPRNKNSFFISNDMFYLIKNNYSLKEYYELVSSKNFIFDGVDGNFYFKNNLIERELKILQINNGKAIQVN